MKTPRLGCERPAGEHDKLEFVRFSSALPFYHLATASSIFVGIPNMVNAL